VKNKRNKFGTVALCDQVYMDKDTGKTILAGMFSGDILTDRFPSMVPCAFYVEIRDLIETSPAATFEIVVGKKIWKRATTTIDTSDSKGPAILVFQAENLLFSEPSTIRLQAKIGSSKKITLMEKTVTLRPNA